MEIERLLARHAGYPEHQVIVYCSPKAPGLQRIRQYVERRPGTSELLDEVYQPFNAIYQRHFALWKVYVLCADMSDWHKSSMLAEKAEEVLGLPNELAISRKQGVLFPD
jgi:hypothetical protein